MLRYRALPLAVLPISLLLLGDVTWAKGPQDPGARALVDAVFRAPPEERAAALEALAPVDALTLSEADAWRKPLLALAGKPGKRRPESGRNTLYADPERGVYLVGGQDGAKGLVVALHGGGAGAGDAAQAASAFGGAISGAKLRMVAPEVLEKTERGWTDPAATERFVLDLIEHVKRAWKLDANRIYLTGHSMGGYGTWTLGAVHADVFGGLAAFAGAPTCLRDTPGGPITAVEDGVLPNLRNLPLFVYQSGDDANVSPESNDFAMPALARLAKDDPGGYPHVYERVEGRGHGFPEKGPQPGLAWATRSPRNPRPSTLVWQPSRAWKRSFYWLWWERPALGTTVRVESRGANRFEVTSAGSVEGLEILLDARRADLASEAVVTVNGRESFRGVPRPSLRVLVRSAVERGDADLLFPVSLPVAPPK